MLSILSNEIASFLTRGALKGSTARAVLRGLQAPGQFIDTRALGVPKRRRENRADKRPAVPAAQQQHKKANKKKRF